MDYFLWDNFVTSFYFYVKLLEDKYILFFKKYNFYKQLVYKYKIAEKLCIQKEKWKEKERNKRKTHLPTLIWLGCGESELPRRLALPIFI